MLSRQEVFKTIQEQPNISVLIIGGGINGISTFRELALQGVDVLMVEKADFNGGASAASSHMVHGGLRYLENSEFRLVREALTERNRLLINAPHQVFPLPTTIPIFKWFSGMLNGPLKFFRLANRPGERGALIIKIGLMLYDIFASTQKTMPNHMFRGKEQTLRRFPGINQDITISATYYDAWMPYPERVGLECVLDAEAAADKAYAVNYVSAAASDGETVKLRDELTGDTYTVKPAVVVNAAGPWIDFANKDLTRDTSLIGGTKGSHLILDHPKLHETLGGHEIFFENKDGRIVLIFPLEDRVIAGTTDIRIDHPDKAVCTEEEIAYILELIQTILPGLNVTREHIVSTFSGVRPLPNQKSATTGQISRDHSVEVIEAGNGTSFPILSLVGGKWTTFRAFGEVAANDVLNRLNVPRQVWTDNMPIGGGANYPAEGGEREKWISRVASQTGVDVERVKLLFKRYGTRAELIARYCSEGDDAPLQYAPDYTRREIAYITLHEKVFTVQDFVLRRSLLALAGKLSYPLLGEIADVIGDTLGWDADQKQAQIDATVERLKIKNLVILKESGSKIIDKAPKEAEVEVVAEPMLP